MSLYLDYNSTTPIDPAVLDAMLPNFQNSFGNPASEHEAGWIARTALDKARLQLAQLLGCNTNEIVFTSGATESNNAVLHGLFESYRSRLATDPFHIITSSYEHNSVARAIDHLEVLGAEVTRVRPTSTGLIEVEQVLAALRPHTKLISIIWVHNEIGSINPIHEIAQALKGREIYIHSDATQAVGRVPLKLDNSNIDFISLSAHKIYGPKGSGALIARKRTKTTGALQPYLWGGGQERGLRSGTVNIPGVVGLGAAAEIAEKNGPEESIALVEKRNWLWQEIQKEFQGCILNGPNIFSLPELRSPNTLNISFLQHDLPAAFKTLCVSRGSACHSGEFGPTRSLREIGLSEAAGERTLRISLGRMTSWDDLKEAVLLLKKGLTKSRIVDLAKTC